MEFTHHAVCPFIMWDSVFLAHPQGCATLTMVLGHFCQPPQKKPHTQPSPPLQSPGAPAPRFTFCHLPAHLPGFLPPTVMNPTRLPSISPSCQGLSECHSLCQCLLDILSTSNIQNQPPSPTPKLPLLYICPSQLMETQGENLPKPSRDPLLSLLLILRNHLGLCLSTSPSSFHPHSDFFLSLQCCTETKNV